MTNRNKVSIPYLEKSKIKAKADSFRIKHWGETIPVDIEHIVEINLCMNIVPVKYLKQSLDVEAGISSNWEDMIVDYDSYHEERCLTRLKFSLAHEIGHLVLHKELFQLLGITSEKDYREFTEEKIKSDCKFHSYAETQANMFANMLLVPREKLFLKKKSLLEDKKNELREFKLEDEEMLNSFLAIHLSREFDVSEDVMIVALCNLKADLTY